MSEPPRTRVIVAVTGEHGRHAAVRSRAADLAAGGHATVILYDLDAAGTFESPVPTNWSSEGAEEQLPNRLGPDDLERAGRAPVADQVRALRQLDVDAWAWLPQDPGAKALAAYARERGAEVILVPEALESPGLLDRLRGNDIAAAGDAAEVPVVVVHAAGERNGAANQATGG